MNRPMIRSDLLPRRAPEWQQTGASWRRRGSCARRAGFGATGPTVAGYGPLADHAGVGGLRLDLTDQELQPWDPPCGAQRWMAPVHRNQSEPRASRGRTEQRLLARAVLAHGRAGRAPPCEGWAAAPPIQVEHKSRQQSQPQGRQAVLGRGPLEMASCAASSFREQRRAYSRRVCGTLGLRG